MPTRWDYGKVAISEDLYVRKEIEIERKNEDIGTKRVNGFEI